MIRLIGVLVAVALGGCMGGGELSASADAGADFDGTLEGSAGSGGDGDDGRDVIATLIQPSDKPAADAGAGDGGGDGDGDASTDAGAPDGGAGDGGAVEPTINVCGGLGALTCACGGPCELGEPCGEPQANNGGFVTYTTECPGMCDSVTTPFHGGTWTWQCVDSEDGIPQLACKEQGNARCSEN